VAETVGVERRAKFYEATGRPARHGAEPHLPASQPHRNGAAELIRG
jgi:hypothetical protein